MKIKKNDIVIIISGKDRGKKGKVTRVLPRQNQVVIEGVNIRKKHSRPKRSGQKGQIMEIFAPIDASNVKLQCPKCFKAARISYKIEGEEKIRVCKKCGQII